VIVDGHVKDGVHARAHRDRGMILNLQPGLP
jgi:hypothetical protein